MTCEVHIRVRQWRFGDWITLVVIKAILARSYRYLPLNSLSYVMRRKEGGVAVQPCKGSRESSKGSPLSGGIHLRWHGILLPFSCLRFAEGTWTQRVRNSFDEQFMIRAFPLSQRNTSARLYFVSPVGDASPARRIMIDSPPTSPWQRPGSGIRPARSVATTATQSLPLAPRPVPRASPLQP